MARGYAITWVECANGDHVVQGTEISDEFTDPFLYNHLRLTAKKIVEGQDDDAQLDAAASLMCMTIKNDDDSAQTAIPTTAALMRNLWKEDFFLVEGECIDHPVPTSDVMTPLDDPGKRDPNETFDQTRRRLFQLLYYRMEKRLGASMADFVERRFKKDGIEDMRGFRYTLADTKNAVEITDSSGRVIDGSHRLAPFVELLNPKKA